MNIDSKKSENQEPGVIIENAIKSINEGVLDALENMNIFTLSFKFLLKKHINIEVTPGKMNITPELRENWNLLKQNLMNEDTSIKDVKAFVTAQFHNSPYEELIEYMQTNLYEVTEEILMENCKRLEEDMLNYEMYQKNSVILSIELFSS